MRSEGARFGMTFQEVSSGSVLYDHHLVRMEDCEKWWSGGFVKDGLGA